MRAIMLTSSSNQYLRPEYLTPLPTTLDAKKSPLALLAQTCSQIGADPPSSSSAKSSLLNGSVSASHNQPSSESSTPSSGTNGSGHGKPSKPGNNHKPNHHQDSNNRKSVSASVSPKSGSPSSSSSANVTTSVNGMSGGSSRSLEEKQLRRSGSKATTPNLGHASPNNSAPPNPANKSPTTTAAALISPTADSTLSSSSSFSTGTTTTSSALSSKPQVVHLTESASSKLLRLSSSHSPLTFGPTTTSTSAAEILALKHGLGFPGLYPPVPSSSAGTGIPPYLHSYARLKAAAASAGSIGGMESRISPSGSNVSSSGCRDPFCTGCQLGQHGQGLSGLKPPCPAGCVVQCDHHKNPASLFSGFSFLPSFPGLPPGFPGYYSGGGSSSLQPYICNWIVSDSYCGKRFSSSEDLLQHLRTHTTPTTMTTSCFGGSVASSLEASAAAAAAVQNLAAAAAAAGYPPTSLPPQAHLHHHPLLTSPHHGHSLLGRNYPTPPLSPHSSARFHPYSKSGGGNGGLQSPFGLSIPPSGFLPSFSGLGHPALSPYYPYSLYGQRLGASAGSLHP